jgi:hypothetical protein
MEPGTTWYDALGAVPDAETWLGRFHLAPP